MVHPFFGEGRNQISNILSDKVACHPGHFRQVPSLRARIIRIRLRAAISRTVSTSALSPADLPREHDARGTSSSLRTSMASACCCLALLFRRWRDASKQCAVSPFDGRDCSSTRLALTHQRSYSAEQHCAERRKAERGRERGKGRTRALQVGKHSWQ